MSQSLAGGRPAPPTVSGVLRAALALVRRRALLFAVLAVALSILPDVVADARADLDDPATSSGRHGEAPDVLTDAVGMLEDVSVLLSLILFDAIVVSMVSRDAAVPSGPAPALSGAVLRLVPVAFAATLLDAGLIALGVDRARGAAEGLISCWILIAPALVAERPRLATLPHRLAVLTQGHRRPAVAIVALCVVAKAAAATLYAELPEALGSETVAGRVADVAGASLDAAATIFAAAVAAALYAALRRAEEPSPAMLAALD